MTRWNGGDEAPPSIVFLPNTSPSPLIYRYVASTSDNQTYSVSGIDFGVAHSKRSIAILWGAGGHGLFSGLSSSAGIIGGVTATDAIEQEFNFGSGGQDVIFNSLKIASIPTGTSGSASITYSAAFPSGSVVQCVVYAIKYLRSLTPTATVTSTGTGARSGNLNVQSRGIVIAGSNGTTPARWGWSGVNSPEEATGATGDSYWGNFTQYSWSASHGTFSSAQTPLSVVSTPKNLDGSTSSANCLMIAAAFR